MRKLYLASVKFKVGDNEFEETRLVASSEKQIEDVSLDAKIAWNYEASGTDRQLISLTVSDTLTIDKSDQIRKPQTISDGHYVKVQKEWLLDLLYHFWNRASDGCPLEASQMEDQLILWRKFIEDHSFQKTNPDNSEDIKGSLVTPLEIVCEVFKKTDDSNSKNQYWLREPGGYVISERPVGGAAFAHYLYGEVKAGKLSIVKN